MRENKSAIVCVVVLLLPVCLFALFHPGHWIFRWNPLPPEPLPAVRPRPVDHSPPPAHFDDFIARYGLPTGEEKSPHGSLQPPLFTKWLDYEPEHLRVAFIAAESPNENPAKRWVLISFVDSTRTVPISAEEAGERLLSRQK